MFRKLAIIANHHKAPTKKPVEVPEELGEAGLGIRNYLESIEDPLSDELLMMGHHEIPEDKTAALVNNMRRGSNTSMSPSSSTPALPSPPIGMDPRDMFGTTSLNPTPRLQSAAPSGETTQPFSESISATGNKPTSSARGGVKNASFLDSGILPAAVGGIGGYIVGEHFIAPHFIRQQAAIAEQLSHGQSALAAAARNQRISPILAAAAGALLLSWLLSDSSKKKAVKDSMGGTGNYAEGLQGFDPNDRQSFTVDNRHPGY
jgi:hypothetical protein